MRGSKAIVTGLVLGVSLMACGGGEDAPPVAADAVERCLVSEYGAEGFSELPLSDIAIAVYAIDLGSKSVQIYVEPGPNAVEEEERLIRLAEDEVGNTAPEQRVILRSRGNVLLAWSHEPDGDEAAILERCTGVR